MIVVYHHDFLAAPSGMRRASEVEQFWKAGGYTKVAEVPSDNLEVAWRKTNSVDEAWYERKDITVFLNGADGLRSSMVGDVFILNGQPYMVAVMGFDKVDLGIV